MFQSSLVKDLIILIIWGAFLWLKWVNVSSLQSLLQKGFVSLKTRSSVLQFIDFTFNIYKKPLARNVLGMYNASFISNWLIKAVDIAIDWLTIILHLPMEYLLKLPPCRGCGTFWWVLYTADQGTGPEPVAAALPVGAASAQTMISFLSPSAFSRSAAGWPRRSCQEGRANPRDRSWHERGSAGRFSFRACFPSPSF